jgi:modification methylase
MILKVGNKKTQTSAFGTNGRINHDSSDFYNSKMYSEILTKQVSSTSNAVPSEILNKIFLKSSENMSELPDNSIHLMVTSPPYNVQKEYDQDLSLNEYLDLIKTVMVETYRVLVDGGRACINVANIGRKPYIPLSSYFTNIMQDIGYNMRGVIIWDKGASSGSSTAWGSWKSASNPTLRDVHEYILVFSKGSYKRVLDDGEKLQKDNTITTNQFTEYTKSIWKMKTESAKKIGHPAPFPIDLPLRLIHLYSFSNDVVLDPFIGSGTTGIASLQTNRYFVGYDISEDYVRIANERIEEQKRSLF